MILKSNDITIPGYSSVFLGFYRLLFWQMNAIEKQSYLTRENSAYSYRNTQKSKPYGMQSTKQFILLLKMCKSFPDILFLFVPLRPCRIDVRVRWIIAWSAFQRYDKIGWCCTLHKRTAWQMLFFRFAISLHKCSCAPLPHTLTQIPLPQRQ